MPKKRKKAVPLALAPLPMASSSRKKARKVTTLFHTLTRQRDAALARNDTVEVQQLDRKIQAMGGREAYQKASQVSTSFYSTSKWVLGVLARNGWLYGIRFHEEAKKDDDETDSPGAKKKATLRKKSKLPRRQTRLLEVGAINTELLDAAAETTVVVEEKTKKNDDIKQQQEETMASVQVPKYKLNVRALDIHSMYPGRIEEADFLTIPMVSDRYDVIVCSMVLNCVTTATARGEMVTRLYHFLVPGGLLFLTIPKSCLTLSPYMDRERFGQLLDNVGLNVHETKETPKVSFFLCCKQSTPELSASQIQAKWGEQKVIRRGKKYRNDFAVTLIKANVLGQSFKNDTDDSAS